MSEDLEDENFSPVVVDGGDEPVVVSGDVENGDGLAAGGLCGICVGECFSNFGNGLPPRGPGHGVPRCERSGGVRVLVGVFCEPPAGDDVHDRCAARLGGSTLCCQYGIKEA